MIDETGVPGGYVLTLLETVGAVAGLTPAAIMARAGLDPARLGNADDLLSMAEVDRLWLLAGRLVPDPALGLMVGRNIRPASFSVVGQVMMTAADLGAAHRDARQLTPLISGGGLIDAVAEPGRTAMRYAPSRPDWPMARQRVEAAISGSLVFARWITGTGIVPIEVRFAHGPPADTGPHLDLFGVIPRFDAGMNALVWSRDQMKTPVREANETLNRLLRSHAEALVREREVTASIANDLRQALRGLIGRGEEPAVAATAKVLNTSARSLQRRLIAEGTSFGAERDRVRLELAAQYLSLTALPVAEIAARLCFAEAAVFVRAFRRWTGATPARWRRDRLSASPSSVPASAASGRGTAPPDAGRT